MKTAAKTRKPKHVPTAREIDLQQAQALLGQVYLLLDKHREDDSAVDDALSKVVQASAFIDLDLE
jgi:hypothetical protein